MNMHFFWKFKKTFLNLVLLAIFCGLLGGATQAQDESDAIAVRIVPNREHYSALRWYREKNLTGSPQSLTVGGYEAVRDERTVIVNAANIYGNNLYTNIYIISFNEEAGKATGDIFSQILKHWKFTVNLVDYGFCRDAAVKNGQRIFCLLDEDCPIGDKCDSVKARVARDTRRLADLAEIKFLAEEYKSRGYYPKLSAGTYLPNKTLSVWPSWRDAFSRELKATLPADPINKLGACTGYNEVTCWDEYNKSFAAAYPDLPDESLAYAYFTDVNGSTVNLCAIFESGFAVSGASVSDLCAPVCLDFDGDGYGRPASSECDFSELDCNDTDSAIHSPTGAEICTGGLDEDCDGLADCHDTICIGTAACAGWPPPPPPTECGNGAVEATEICEPGHPIYPCPIACSDGDDCTNDMLVNGGTCNAYCSYPDIIPCCGNGDIEAGEICDPCPSSCNDFDNCTTDLTSGSAATCDLECSHATITTCSLTVNDGCCPVTCNATTDLNCSPVCGNGIVESGEACDPCPTSCDDGNSCTIDNMSGGAATCDLECSHATINTCSLTVNDGCCPVTCNSTNDMNCAAVCGNGLLETGEICEPGHPTNPCPTACDDGNPCTDNELVNPGTCSAQCNYPAMTTCADSDGCCPTGCTLATDNDCVAVCGNGSIESGETCDPPATCPTAASCSDADDCTTHTYSGSAAACNALCDVTTITTCVNGDGCCPASCTSATDNDCASLCIFTLTFPCTFP